jgi:hypothetical protein
MAERALELQPAFSKMFANVHQAWMTEGSILAQRPEILNYQFTTPEWRVVAVLQRILKQFAISSRQLRETQPQHTADWPVKGLTSISRLSRSF